MFKKLFFAVGALCLMSGVLRAQDSNVQVGIEGGLNLAKQSSGGSGSTGNLTAFHAGVLVDLKLDAVTIEPGLFYSVKGGKYDAATTISDGTTTYSASTSAKLTLNYLELPVNVLYNIPVAGSGHLFVGGGPYAAYGLSGKMKYSASASGGGNSQSQAGEQNVSFGSGADQYKALDFGINFKGGYRFSNGLQLSVGYGLGLANLSNDNQSSVKNNVFRASLGYFF
jgi:hypothetical protein